MRHTTSNSPKNLLKCYRHLLIAVIGWVIWMVIFFWTKKAIAPRYFIHCSLDDKIPFCKWFLPAYCLWYLYLFAPLMYLGLKAKDEFIRLQTCLFVGMGFCLVFYIFYPNAINFRPEVTGNDFLSLILRHMFAVDSSNMVTPSMHVLDSVVIHIALVKSPLLGQRKPIIISSFIAMVLICVSTVMIKQHSVIDVFWGVIAALILCVPFYFARGGRKAKAS